MKHDNVLATAAHVNGRGGKDDEDGVLGRRDCKQQRSSRTALRRVCCSSGECSGVLLCVPRGGGGAFTYQHYSPTTVSDRSGMAARHAVLRQIADSTIRSKRPFPNGARLTCELDRIWLAHQAVWVLPDGRSGAGLARKQLLRPSRRKQKSATAPVSLCPDLCPSMAGFPARFDTLGCVD